jgi:DNA-binding transcriptional ArsR family regulator
MNEEQRAGHPVSAAADLPGVSVAKGDGIPDLRQVSEVETLKALADPIRLRILTALMRFEGDPVLMSVKELAEQLGEPQTKLYRHVKQLEATGLIKVAATRLVSGIVEQRYQASQRDLMFGPSLLRHSAANDELEAAVANLLRHYGEQFFTAVREGRIEYGDFPAEQAYRKHLVLMSESRVAADRATAIRNKLQEVMEELNGPDDRDGVPVSILIGFFSPAEDDPA